MITDSELQGLALQALNMAKKDHMQGKLCCVIATYHEGEGIHRMRIIEDLLVKKLGQDWLNKGNSKDFAFGLLRKAIRHQPCDAFVFACAGNQFNKTEAFSQLDPQEQKPILGDSHDRHHQAVKEGLFSIHDAIQTIAQTANRVCAYIQVMSNNYEFEGPPQVQFFDQYEFQGRMKMFGTEE